jgi:hypothetical protein
MHSEGNYQLGGELTKEGMLWRIIRITHQTSLFQIADGVLETVEEKLLELKSVTGAVDFLVLTTERTSFEGPGSIIKAPEPIIWRKD